MIRVDITDFHAKPDAASVQTRQIQDAIDYCFERGGGEVCIPAGTYIIGDIRVRSNITLHLLENAILLGSVDPEEYRNILTDKLEPLPDGDRTNIVWKSIRERTPEESMMQLDKGGSRWNSGMIKIEYAENVSIIGEKGSVIDGRNCFDVLGEERYRGPHGINVHHSKNLCFSGYTIKNTGNWAHCIYTSSNITMDNVTILAGHDGTHFRGCDNVVVKNCVIRTGDDCIAGFDDVNVLVKNCNLRTACNVFRFGGTNVIIEDCDVKGPSEYPFRGSLTQDEKERRVSDSPKARKNTASFFTYIIDNTRLVRYRPGNIVIRNCNVDGADRFFRLNLSGTELWQKGVPPESVRFENITVKGAKHWICAYGNDDLPFELIMNNIEYEIDEESCHDPFLHCGKYGGITLKNIIIHGFKGDTLIRTWGDVDKIYINNLNCNNEKKYKVIEKMTEPFDLRYI